MMPSLAVLRLSLLGLLVSFTDAECFDPSPAFPVPLWSDKAKPLASALSAIELQLEAIARDSKYNASSFSIELTSNTDTLWGSYSTALVRNESRPGTKDVDTDSIYRIASITKTFTVLGVLQQAKAGNLSLDDPILNYIPELASKDAGALPWKDITLRSLASQLSGIPREFAQSDLVNSQTDPTAIGLPPISRKVKDGLVSCDQFSKYTRPCSRDDLLDRLKELDPLFAPNAQSTYSNVAFELLGLAIENATGGVVYDDYIQDAIFDLVGMNATSFKTPSDTHAVLPLLPDGQHNYWDVQAGTQKPTGGIYASAKDMSAYLRYILTHFNALATGVNWFLPQSFATGMQSFYGMPWEIYRASVADKGNVRPVTFVTKSGGLPGYYSKIVLMPEYGLGLTVLVGGKATMVDELLEAVTGSLIPAVERTIWIDIDDAYTGRYTAITSKDDSGDTQPLNSSLTLTTSLQQGLQITSFISNSTDVFATLLPRFAPSDPQDPDSPTSSRWHVQLVPTLLYKNETAQRGEIWRMLVVPHRDGSSAGSRFDGVDESSSSSKGPGIWDEFCITDIDLLSYAGLPLNELVFWRDEDGGVEVELPAWRVTMEKDEDGEGDRAGEGSKNGRIAGGLLVQRPHRDL